MGPFEPGDYVKAEFTNGTTGEREWMWVKIDAVDDTKRVVLGRLDNQPLVNNDLYLGMDLAVSYDNIREHLKDSVFNQ